MGWAEERLSIKPLKQYCAKVVGGDAYGEECIFTQTTYMKKMFAPAGRSLIIIAGLFICYGMILKWRHSTKAENMFYIAAGDLILGTILLIGCRIFERNKIV